ncbi:asialoglycoprotein receptor 1 isoform X2 [Oryzias melastigma]|uniref:asialoglycoprotein receptor 1 isoform X2 n=1 Tax=Oryzias melastigma TaxID=30732 RepID=UPI00168D0B9A|nr:asialoglycoprotein receptor 1 isoform X2 [Oryzias melastigma]
MEEDIQYSTVEFKSGASAPKDNREDLTVYSSLKIKKPLTSETQNKEDDVIYSQVVPRKMFPSAPPNQNEPIYSDIKKGKPKIKKENAPTKKNPEADFDTISKETTQTAVITEVQTSGSRFHLLLVCLGIICFLLCASIIVVIFYFTMETNKQKQNLSNLEAKNEQLTLEKRYLQNQTEYLTADKMLFENQTKEMTVNMTIQQTQIEQLRNSSDKLNRMKAAIFKYSTFPVDLFCPDGVCQTCPKDWIQFQESCYFFNHFISPWKTWDESRQLCRSNNSDLVVISSQEEQKFIKSRIKYYYDEWHGYWIGLRRINNNWIWVDDSQDTLGYWKNPGSSEDFVHVVHDGPLNQSWVQLRNGFQNRFICEIKAFIF